MIAWLALGVALLVLGLDVAVVVLARRFWRQVRPQVEPLLGMFAVPASTSPGPESGPRTDPGS